MLQLFQRRREEAMRSQSCFLVLAKALEIRARRGRRRVALSWDRRHTIARVLGAWWRCETGLRELRVRKSVRYLL